MKGALTVVGGVFIHVALGVLFTFGNINPYVTSYLRFCSSESTLEYSDTMWIMGYFQVSLHMAMMCGGVIELMLGPRITSLLGGLCSSLGLALTYFTVKHSFTATSVSYGWIFGIGVGIAYSSSLGRAMKVLVEKYLSFAAQAAKHFWITLWYPNGKGLVSGLVTGSAGVSAIMFSEMETVFTNPANLVANVTVGTNNDKYFGQPVVLNRVPYLFLPLGGICGVLCSIGSLLLFNPPSNVLEETRTKKSYFQELTGTDENMEEHDTLIDKTDLPFDTHPMKMIKTKNFWILWFLSLVNGMVMIFVLAFFKAYGQTFIPNDFFLAFVGSVGTGFISVGRLFWGFIADRLPLRIGFIIQNALMLFLLLTFTLSDKAGQWMYFSWVVTMFATSGGTTTYLTAASASSFGLKFFSTNYGLVSSSMIFGGILGSILSQTLNDQIGWFGIFALIGGFSFFGIVLSYFYDAEYRS